MSLGETALLAGQYGLIVDDEPESRRRVAEALREAGLRAAEMADVSSVAQALEERAVALIVVSATSDVPQAMTTVKAIRATAAGERLPLVVITAAGDADAVDQAFAAGATAFVMEPVDPPIFARHVRHVLRTHRHFESLLESQAKLQRLAEFDELTELPNREHFAAQLEEAMTPGGRLGIIVLDLDRFLRINSALGREAGDAILRQSARRLQNWRDAWKELKDLTHEPLVARLGSDEFGVLLPRIPRDATVYQALDRLREALEQPIQWQDREIVISFTAGIALHPDAGRDAGRLIDHAEAAAARAKTQSQGGDHLYSGVQDARELDRLYLEKEFRKALAEDALRLAYQPKINLRSGEMVAVEALARWDHPVRGAIGPGEFVPIAEELGLSDRLGEYVLMAACRQLAEWLQSVDPCPGVAVNISASQFARGGVTATVRRAIEETGINPSYLEIEVTEGALMGPGSEIELMLHQLRDCGVQVSVDDFGTGYSSLSYLKRFPIDALKIDRSFVADVDTNEQSAAIVEAVTKMAHGLRLEVIAEGIERRPQYDVLHRLGCDIGQGFWFARALSPEDLAPLFNRNFLQPAAKPWQHQALSV